MQARMTGGTGPAKTAQVISQESLKFQCVLLSLRMMTVYYERVKKETGIID